MRYLVTVVGVDKTTEDTLKNDIWVIFECDAHMSFSSYVVKMMTTDSTLAQQEFDRLAKLFNKDNPDNWLLNLATHDSSSPARLDGNVLARLTVVSSSADISYHLDL